MAYRILVSAPVPLGLSWVLNWVGLGLGLGGLRTKGLGTGLYNSTDSIEFLAAKKQPLEG